MGDNPIISKGEGQKIMGLIYFGQKISKGLKFVEKNLGLKFEDKKFGASNFGKKLLV